ncbi:hypothetical protein ABFV58_07825 [Pseudomonas protegens]|uniref:hypothetical protein n=1 Tax=Pseudomonas protegens TaxID=380021 RepID=UPI0034D5FC11
MTKRNATYERRIVDAMGKKIHRLKTSNELIIHEITILKLRQFAKRSEQSSIEGKDAEDSPPRRLLFGIY